MECLPAIILILFTNYNNFCGVLQLSPTGKNLAPKLNCHLCEGEDCCLFFLHSPLNWGNAGGEGWHQE